ncbi:MAG TPA: MFS transporter [Planctomycetaceae bacterium]|nr:MFS transporter [Planctomycetaceae bacterium]
MSSSSASLPSPTPATSHGAWMALLAALLGWMFDGAEMGVFSVVGRAAVQNLLHIDGKPSADQEAEIGFLFGVIIASFLVGAATGGVVFGWLGDRIGRVRAMSFSILTYALFTGFCGFAQTPLQLGGLRFIASLGMGGEWALGVALVMEVWPNKSRALMAGLIGAAANAGYALVGVIGIGLNSLLSTFEGWMLSAGLSTETVEMLVAFKGWRLMMMLGVLPAILTALIRVFVPESEKWEQEKSKGGTSHWATVDMLGVLIGACGPGLIIYCWATSTDNMVRLVGTGIGVVIATIGYLYPVFRYLQRERAANPQGLSMRNAIPRMLLGAVLSGVALLGTWGSTQWAPSWSAQLIEKTPPEQVAALGAIGANPREYTLIMLSIGAIVGTIVAALAGDWLGRRTTYCLMCVGSLISVLGFFQLQSQFGWVFLISSFLVGAISASFYGWLPLYLPELFATRIRATGQGFSFNFGRIISAIGAMQVGALLSVTKGYKTLAGVEGGYAVACSFVVFVYFVGLVAIWFGPETRGKPLPE